MNAGNRPILENDVPRSARRRGFALVMVLSVVAFTTVMGLAMLMSGSLHAQVGNNAALAAQSDAAAESGINLALYYLQNKNAAPVGFQNVMNWNGSEREATDDPLYSNHNVSTDGTSSLTSTAYPDGTPRFSDTFAVQSPGSGSFTLTVERVTGSSGMYDITCTGAASTGNSIPRTISTRVKSNLTTFSIPWAVAFNTTTTVSRPGYLTVTGTATSKGVVSGFTDPVSSGGVAPAPTVAQVFDYDSDTYWYGDPPKEYNVQLLSNQHISTPINPDPVTNPAGIFRSTRPLVYLEPGAQINGTLIAPNKLHIAGALLGSNSVTVTQSRPGYPALIVRGRLIISGGSDKLIPFYTKATINGACWVGGGIMMLQPYFQNNSNVTINGSLLMDTSTPTFSGLTTTINNFTMTVTDADIAGSLELTELSPAKQTAISSRIMTWSE